MADAYLREHPPPRRQYRSPRRAPVTTITLHTFEASIGQTAEWGARFIQRRLDPGSYHRLGDIYGSEIQLVRYGDEAFHDGTGGNRFSIGISLMMNADDWPTLRGGRSALLADTMASMAAHADAWVKATYGYDIPPRLLTKAQSDRGERGFISHARRDPSRRTDPGPDFSWPLFFDLYQHHLQGDPVVKRNQFVEQLQTSLVERGLTDVDHGDPEAVRRYVDGVMGPVTLGDTLAGLDETDGAAVIAAATALKAVGNIADDALKTLQSQ